MINIVDSTTLRVECDLRQELSKPVIRVVAGVRARVRTLLEDARNAPMRSRCFCWRRDSSVV